MPDDKRDTVFDRKLTAQDRSDEAQAHADRAQERAVRAEARAERAEGRAQEHSAKNRRSEPPRIDAHGQMKQQMLGEMLVQAELEEAAEKQAFREKALRDEERQSQGATHDEEASERTSAGQGGPARVERSWSQDRPPQRALEIASRAKHADLAASKAALTASKAYSAHREFSRQVEQGRFASPYAKPDPDEDRKP